MMVMVDYIYATMPRNLDNYAWIIDLSGAGWKHFYLDTMKGIADAIHKNHVNTNHKIVCIYPNFITRMCWKTISPFLAERVKAKISFISEVTLESLAAVGLELERLPSEWGGEGPHAVSMVGQQQDAVFLKNPC